MKNISVLGRIGKVYEKKINNSFLLTVSIAVNEKIKNEKITTWFDVISFNKEPHKIIDYLKVGDLLAVSGDLSFSAYLNKKNEAVAVAQIKFPKFALTAFSSKQNNIAQTNLTLPLVNEIQEGAEEVENSTDDLPF